jgi:hypothetical protein
MMKFDCYFVIMGPENVIFVINKLMLMTLIVTTLIINVISKVSLQSFVI